MRFPPLDDSDLVTRKLADSATALVPHRPRLVTEDMVALRLAALTGIGVAQFPTMVVGEDLAAGRLVDILPRWTPRTGIIHAAFPSRRGLLPSVRALLDFLAGEYAALDKMVPGGRSSGGLNRRRYRVEQGRRSL